MDPKTTGQFIAALRKEKNLTQKQLSEKMNVSDKAVSRWETGKGYPDIESLMSLSEEFLVSINELLYGKRIESSSMAKDAEKDMATSYIKTNTKKRFVSIIAIALAITTVLVCVLSAVAIFTLYINIMGSPDCVISEDYSYLTLYGEHYLPFVTDDKECKVTDQLIKEAQVENVPFIGKLLFGESVYSIDGCTDNDIIYLQTEYDDVVSRYYCKESELEYYTYVLNNLPYDKLIAEITTSDWNLYDSELTSELSNMLLNEVYTLSNIGCNWSRGSGDESVVIYSVQTEGIFRKPEGELLRKDNEYYWFDYDDIPETQSNGYYGDIMAYRIDDSYDDELDIVFSYMFK